MKIDHIDVHTLRFEYPDGGFWCAGGNCKARVTSLIIVHCDGGQTGIGSVYSHPALVEVVVKGQLEPFLRGQDPTRVEELWDRMYGLTRWYGRKGAALSALGGLDTAFWDLRGKAKGKPIWKLLGGERSSCPAYASALLWKTPKALAGEAELHLARGFRRMKMRLGKSETEDLEAVESVRRAIGDDHDVLVDASMRYNVELASRVGNRLAELRVFWFEEPFLPEDIDSYTALRGSVGVRVAAGENEFGLQGFRELIRAEAVDIVQPDASRCGGITEVSRVVKLAREAGLVVAPHSWSDAVAIITNAHAVAAASNGLTVEVDQTGNPFVEDLLETRLQIVDGLLEIGDAPGLGIELRDDVIQRYRVPDPLQLADGYYSDMVFGAEYLRPAGCYEEAE